MDLESTWPDLFEIRDLPTLIKHLFPRPVMYAGSRNLEAIATYIEGFAFATAGGHKEMREFNRWLAKKLKFSANIPWWVGLNQSFESDDDALEALPGLFQEFWTK